MERRISRSVAVALVLGGCAAVAPGFYDSAPLDDPVLGPCVTKRVYGNWIYQESDRIVVYLEAGDLAAYRQALPAQFAMPERPLIRVSVIDFYEMVNGPTYLESEVSVLAVHEGRPGWFVLTLPVTDGNSCAGGRRNFGYPKVVRRITLERGADRYVGISYVWGGRAPEFTLTLDVGEPGETAREGLGSMSPFPHLTLLGGGVMTLGALSQPVADLERQGILKIRFGRARLEFSREPDSLLHRLGVGQPVLAFWARIRAQSSITPR